MMDVSFPFPAQPCSKTLRREENSPQWFRGCLQQVLVCNNEAQSQRDEAWQADTVVF